MKQYIVLLLAISLMVAGCETQDKNITSITPPNTDSEETDNKTPLIGKDNTSVISTKYAGRILAGTSAPYIEFNYADYQDAVDDGKIIFLYFYADWSDTAKADQKAIYDAFDRMGNDDVVGFRVNFEDDNTDTAEAGLASQFNVDDARVKVIVVDGEMKQKTISVWNENDYFRQITQYIED